MTGKTKVGRMRGVYIILLLFAPAILLIVLSRGCENKFQTLDVLGQVNNYSFEGVDGKTYTQDDFKGNVVMFINLQNECLDTCSISLFTFEKILYQHIRPKTRTLGHMRIVAFVNDQDGNPVSDLKPMEDLLKDKIHHYDPKKWILAKGDAKQVYDIERNGQNLLQEGISYRELMLLVDKDNQLRMVLRGNAEGMFRRMKESIALLQKEYSVKDAEAKEKK